MKNFDVYAQEVNRLCDQVLAESDADLASRQLLRKQEKIRRSELTVYQKYFLLQQLNLAREDANTRENSKIKNRKRSEQKDCHLQI